MTAVELRDYLQKKYDNKNYLPILALNRDSVRLLLEIVESHINKKT